MTWMEKISNFCSPPAGTRFMPSWFPTCRSFWFLDCMAFRDLESLNDTVYIRIGDNRGTIFNAWPIPKIHRVMCHLQNSAGHTNGLESPSSIKYQPMIGVNPVSKVYSPHREKRERGQSHSQVVLLTTNKGLWRNKRSVLVILTKLPTSTCSIKYFHIFSLKWLQR